MQNHIDQGASLPLPYSGLKVLDVSQGIAGPYCAHILWQQGADVIKLEPPSGDWGRHVGVVRGEHSALSVQFNAGKRAIALDTRQAEGREVLWQLATQADILVQNFRPGVAARMGIDYQRLSREKPGLVYVSISGYGDSGPYADAPASDSVMQADSGLMFSNQDEQGQPRRIGMLIADIATGLYAAQATATALYQRLARGAGSHVQTSLFEACASLQGMNMLEQAIAGERPFTAVSAPNGVFATADGRMTVLALNNDQFQRLCRALGRDGWLSDARYADNASRMQHKAQLHAELAALLGQHPTSHWMHIFQQHEVLHARVNNYDGVMQHPQSLHLNMFQQLQQGALGSLPYLGFPVAPWRRTVGPAPRIGEHSVDILRQAGMPPERIRTLLAAGVLAQTEE